MYVYILLIKITYIISTNLKTLAKAGLTLNDLYDTTCMTHNQLSNFYGVNTTVQVVQAKFITDYSAFRSSSKII